MKQQAHGFGFGAEPLVQLRFAQALQLRSDPFERSRGRDYVRWFIEHAFVPSRQAIVSSI
jgi:hypothetical protein